MLSGSVNRILHCLARLLQDVLQFVFQCRVEVINSIGMLVNPFLNLFEQ